MALARDFLWALISPEPPAALARQSVKERCRVLQPQDA
jgi:hypothetical protein